MRDVILESMFTTNQKTSVTSVVGGDSQSVPIGDVCLFDTF